VYKTKRYGITTNKSKDNIHPAQSEFIMKTLLQTQSTIWKHIVILLSQHYNTLHLKENRGAVLMTVGYSDGLKQWLSLDQENIYPYHKLLRKRTSSRLVLLT